MSDLDHLGRLFFEVHSDLWREGPGSRASTLRALELARPHLGDEPRVVDVGCGPGAQTLVLLEALPTASITAIDLHRPFLDQLDQRLRDHPGAERVETIKSDMREWSPPGSIDLVWCEGAAYIMGFERALERWSSWQPPGGIVAVSEAVWLTDAPTPPATALWEEYPAMVDRAGCRERVGRAGYELVGEFVLPTTDWLDEYYQPIQERIDDLRSVYSGDAEAIGALDEHQREIDVYRACANEYGYLFVVARRSRT